MGNSTKFALSLIVSIVLGASLGMVTGRLFPLSEPEATEVIPETAEPTAPLSVAPAGTTFETTVITDGIGEILVQVVLPESARYNEGAPIVVNVPTFFTPEISGFHPLDGLTEEGIISISLMYPGRADKEGNSSEGTDDFGGPDSIKALRDVLLFALGEKTNSDGYSLKELSAVSPLYSDVGIYAFSHPGIAATAVLGTYPEELQNISYLVGRENPTTDLFSALELGHWETSGKTQVAVANPLYKYPEDYSSTSIDLDYSSAYYDQSSGAPYFDTNHNKKLDSTEFSLGTQVPTMFGKRYYSRALLHALEDNGALTASSWPSDLATPEEADATWPSRETLPYYSKLNTELHVMLVFAEHSHVQVSVDQPSIHQAYDGLSAAGLWIRLNPDASYVSALDSKGATDYSDHDANTEPSNWADLGSWAYATGTYSGFVPLASVLEMADRTHEQNWSDNLSQVLN